MRPALGATARQLVTLVVGQALRPVLIGALLGVGAAFASGRLLDSLLFEIGSADPGSFGTATVLLWRIDEALLACAEEADTPRELITAIHRTANAHRHRARNRKLNRLARARRRD